MKFAVVVFPGSNCDHDAYHAVKHVLGQEAAVRLAQGHGSRRRRRRHPARRLLPRRLPAHRRDRALLARSWRPLRTFAERGGPVLGICNGFQILLEAGLLPGAMLRNRELKFRCEHVHLRVEQTDTPFTAAARSARCCGFRSRTAKATTTRAPDVLARLEAEPAGRLPLHRRRTGELDRRGEPERIAATASPASATRRETSSA